MKHTIKTGEERECIVFGLRRDPLRRLRCCFE